MKYILKLWIPVTLVLSSVVVFNDKNSLIAKNEYIEINIQRFYTHIDDLSVLEEEYLGKTEIVDLTAVTGIASIQDFKEIYSSVELPNLYAGIGLFSGSKKIDSFSQSTSNWKENWTTDSIKLVEDSEWKGSAYIYGILSTKIEIIKHVKLNHLLLKFSFYGAGAIKSTGSSPWGTIDSGWVLRLNAK